MAKPADQTLHCEHFGRCGGCSALDVPIADQLARKRARVEELLAPFLAGVAVDCPLPPRTPRHDRTQILYPARPHPRLLLQLGIYRTGTHRIEPIRDCRIQQKPLTVLGVRAGDICRELAVDPYDETTGKGILRAFRARIAPGTGELLFGFVTTRAGFAQRDALASEVWQAASDLRDDQGRPVRPVGCVLTRNDRPGNSLLGGTDEPLLGNPWQHDLAGGLRFRISFASFYQQNRHADAILYRPALAMAGPVSGLAIVDGYGGVGTFGLRFAAAGARQVTIVENSGPACADARANVAENGLANVAVVEQAFDQAEFEAPDLLVVDPPRAGLQAGGVARVLAADAPRVLVVACSAESLARDLAGLDARYRVAALRVCDLFPHTEHVELLGMLERR
jgi:23S rRNA (uracil1939-C5)-methyltransferase